MENIIFDETGLPIFPHKVRYYARTGDLNAISNLMKANSISPLEFIFDAVQFGRTEIVQLCVDYGFKFTAEMVKTEIAEFEFVSLFEKPENINYSEMKKLLKNQAELSDDLIDELIEASRSSGRLDDEKCAKFNPTDFTENSTKFSDLSRDQKMGLDRETLLSRGLSIDAVFLGRNFC